MKKKMLLLIITILFIKIDISALTYGGCDYSSISRLRSLISNVNISYDYKFVDNLVYFDVTLNNIPPNVYFIDSNTNIKYTYYNTQDGEITIYNYNGYSGNYKFYSALDACYGISLGTKYYKFPKYNYYHNDPLCKDIPNYSLCKKWANVTYSHDEFEQLIIKYKEKTEDNSDIEDNVRYKKNPLDVLVDLYINYYYYYLGSIIIICLIIIIVKRRKERFKL